MRGRVFKRSEESKTWTVVYDIPKGDDGKRKQKTETYRTREEADRALARALNAVYSGAYVDPSKLTVKELFTQFLESNRGRWANRTYQWYEEKSRNYIIPELGGIQLSKLEPARIDRFLSGLKKSGGRSGEGISPQTTHHCRTALRAAINWGLKKGKVALGSNPVTRTDPIKFQPQEMTILTPAECVVLMEAVVGSLWEMPIALSLHTGMRQGECLALAWSDIDFKTNTIRVRHALERIDGQPALKPPKNRSSIRSFDFTEDLGQVLTRQKQIHELRRLDIGKSYDSRGFVCAQEDGSPMLPWQVTRGLHELLKMAGVPDIRFHDLRHTHISVCLAGGESVVRVAKRVGHADRTMILRVYGHTIPGDSGMPTHFTDALRHAKEHPNE